MEMDHSYSKGRDRVQKTDHSYFTVGKKTPQVVLRKAQHLKELTHDSTKSAVGQDHSYVRAEHAVNANSFDCDTALDVESPLRIAPDLCSADLLWSSAARDYDGLSPESPEKVAQKNNLNCNSLTLDGDVSRQTAVEALLALDCVGFKCSVMDDLQCWIGSIQLDHTYGGSGIVSPGQDSNPCEADHSYGTCVTEGSVSWNSQYHLDHPYDSQRGQRVSIETARDQASSLPDAKGLHQITCWEIEPVQDELEEKQRCVDKRALSENSDLANDDPSFIFHQYGDHAYEATASNPSNVVDEFRSDHSYDIKSNSGACDNSGNPDWWDHAYVVDSCSSRSTIESCSYSCDIGLSIAGWGIVDAALGEALG